MEEDIKLLKENIDNIYVMCGFSITNALERMLNELDRLQKENKLYKHRLEVANEFIESRIDGMIPEHYDDLKYIINECDINSTW